MEVAIEIERSINVPAPYSQTQSLLQDLEGTIRRFPKLKNLKRLGEMAYLWQMAPIGSKAANISHEVAYAAQYAVDLKKGRLSWKSLPQYGNATIEGAFHLATDAAQTRLTFHVFGELRGVPVPFLYRLVAPPFIQGKFTHLVDVFLEKTREALMQNQVQPGAG